METRSAAWRAFTQRLRDWVRVASSILQQARLGAQIIDHRGGLKKFELWLADPRFVEQLMALRLAVILVHARRKLPNGVFTLTRGEKTVHLALAPDWAASDPQTLYLLSKQAGAWERAGVRIVMD